MTDTAHEKAYPAYKISEDKSLEEKPKIFFTSINTTVCEFKGPIMFARVHVLIDSVNDHGDPGFLLTGVFKEGLLHRFIENDFNDLYGDYQQAIVEFFVKSFENVKTL